MTDYGAEGPGHSLHTNQQKEAQGTVPRASFLFKIVQAVDGHRMPESPLALDFRVLEIGENRNFSKCLAPGWTVMGHCRMRWKTVRGRHENRNR